MRSANLVVDANLDVDATQEREGFVQGFRSEMMCPEIVSGDVLELVLKEYALDVISFDHEYISIQHFFEH